MHTAEAGRGGGGGKKTQRLLLMYSIAAARTCCRGGGRIRHPRSETEVSKCGHCARLAALLNDNGFLMKFSSYRVLCVPRGSGKGLPGTEGYGEAPGEMKEGVGKNLRPVQPIGSVPLDTVHGQ